MDFFTKIFVKGIREQFETKKLLPELLPEMSRFLKIDLQQKDQTFSWEDKEVKLEYFFWSEDLQWEEIDEEEDISELLQTRIWSGRMNMIITNKTKTIGDFTKFCLDRYNQTISFLTNYFDNKAGKISHLAFSIPHDNTKNLFFAGELPLDFDEISCKFTKKDIIALEYQPDRYVIELYDVEQKELLDRLIDFIILSSIKQNF